MKIIDQQGKTQEVFEIENVACKLYGYPLSVRKPKIFLGQYDSRKRAIEVMSEAVAISWNNKNTVYTMPEE